MKPMATRNRPQPTLKPIKTLARLNDKKLLEQAWHQQGGYVLGAITIIYAVCVAYVVLN